MRPVVPNHRLAVVSSPGAIADPAASSRDAPAVCTRDDRDDDGQLTDDALMIRHQEGVAAAFTELAVRYRQPLTGFFIKKLRDRTLADDLVQETLLKVFSAGWDYIPQGRFRGWLFRIAHNLTIDTVRKQARDVLLPAYTGTDDDPSPTARFADDLLPPEQQSLLSERAEAIDALVDDLPDDQRDTVILHYFNGVPLPEVAVAMETTLSTCKSRLRLAREKLAGRIVAAGWVDP